MRIKLLGSTFMALVCAIGFAHVVTPYKLTRTLFNLNGPVLTCVTSSITEGTTTLNFDLAGKLLLLTESDNADKTESYAYSYNSLDQLVQVHYQTTERTEIHTYSYDTKGSLVGGSYWTPILGRAVPITWEKRDNTFYGIAFSDSFKRAFGPTFSTTWDPVKRMLSFSCGNVDFNKVLKLYMIELLRFNEQNQVIARSIVYFPGAANATNFTSIYTVNNHGWPVTEVRTMTDNENKADTKSFTLNRTYLSVDAYNNWTAFRDESGKTTRTISYAAVP